MTGRHRTSLLSVARETRNFSLMALLFPSIFAYVCPTYIHITVTYVYVVSWYGPEPPVSRRGNKRSSDESERAITLFFLYSREWRFNGLAALT
ncbi:hypothetical protein F4779DRAFT_517129 [Xylariaceae sp. FL0662B]|nr:hypothetical protein F4779DRAFT_517129 [Xylariaceae sp. FL0662B]